MTAIAPAGIAAQQALTQQAVSLEVVRASAEADRQIANILTEAVEGAASSGRGSIVNITA